MEDRIVLITKDAVCKSYLPIYGNQIFDMPNLSELAAKGTVFNRYYASAPSTAMSFISMFTQKQPYETTHKTYVAVTEVAKDTIFDKLYNQGYECRIIWDEKWVSMAQKYSQCYGEHTKFDLLKINQTVGTHLNEVKVDDRLADETVEVIKKAIENAVQEANEKFFLWIHLPHVLLGRNCYASDLDMFDRIIGCLREHFSDDSIFISSDHGNMNGVKNKIRYGFDVYETAINIPLITPRINGLKSCDIPISNVHMFDLLQGEIPKEEFVYADSAYYAQLHRKMAIIHGDFKYIYNKEDRTEELYDLKYDPNENCNIAQRKVYDVDRKLWTPLDQVYYYPDWERADKELKIMRTEKERIWRQESTCQRILAIIRRRLGFIHAKLLQIKANKNFKNT